MNKNASFGWSPEFDAQLLRLRHTDQLSWQKVGEAMGRAKTCVHFRYTQLVLPEDRQRLFRRPQWSTEAEAELLKLRAENLTVNQIAKKLGRRAYEVSGKLQRLSAVKRGRVHGGDYIKQFVPQAVRDERDARMNAEHSDIALLCGEPRPGQSALDRKLAGIVDPPHRDFVTQQCRPKPTLAGMKMVPCIRCSKPIPDLTHEEDADFGYCYECFQHVLAERTTPTQPPDNLTGATAITPENCPQGELA